MARDPNEIHSEGMIDDPEILKGYKIPDGVDKTQLGTEFYAYQRTYKNGRRVVQWFKRGTGDGKNDPEFATSEDTVPAVKTKWDDEEAKTPPTVSAPPNQPNIVSRNPDGSLATAPNPNYTPPGTATTRTPEQTQIDAANAQVAQENAKNAAKLNAERDWHESQGHGRYTHAEWEQKLDADKKAAESAGNTAEANRLARERFEWDKQKAALPDVRVEAIDRGGQRYVQVISTPKDGKSEATIVTYGPDGKRIAAPPSEGEATAGGPPMPNFVLHASEQALTAYHAALWKDPSLTPAQREKRFAEAVQIANVKNQEWATLQNERESRRNAAYHTASTKLSAMQTATNQAMDFVSRLNATLPVGSDQGGRAFAALLGLNMIQMGASGINDLGAFDLPTLTPADLTNPARLEAKRAEIGNAVTAAAAATATPAPPNATGAEALGNQPVPGTAPPPAAPVAPAAPAIPSGMASPPTGMPGYDQPLVTPTSPPTGMPGYDAPVAPADTAPPVGAAPQAGPGAPPAPSPAPVVAPGGRVLPQPGNLENERGQPGDPVYPLPPGEITKAPWQQYPAIATMAPKVPFVPPAPQPQANPAAFRGNPAVLHNRAATTPPWRLSSQEIEEMQAAGIDPETIWSVPGRVA